MASSRELPWLLLVALCAALAIGLAAYGLGRGAMSAFQVAVALVSLAIGQLIVFARFSARSTKTELDMRRMAMEVTALMRETREERRVAADLSADVSVMRSEHNAMGNSIAAGFNDLRQSHAHLADTMRHLMSRPVEQQYREPSPMLAPSSAAYQPPLPPQPEEVLHEQQVEAPAYVDSLQLSLEPIIDLFSSKTAHYRLHYTMVTANGGDLSQEQINQSADKAGLRPGLDLHLARETLALLRRLRSRDPKLGLIMSVGAATLSMHAVLRSIIELRAEEPETGAGLIVDLPHAVLASLPSSALEGLAYLARSGINLSLSNASVSGLDLASLEKLNVHLVGVSAASVGAEPKMSKGIAGFVQAARALGVHVVVSEVSTATQAGQIARIARFASGPAFAEPRRVRREATAGQDAFSAAAE